MPVGVYKNTTSSSGLWRRNYLEDFRQGFADEGLQDAVPRSYSITIGCMIMAK